MTGIVHAACAVDVSVALVVDRTEVAGRVAGRRGQRTGTAEVSCPVALAEQDAPSLFVGDGASPNAGQHLFNAKSKAIESAGDDQVSAHRSAIILEE